MDPKFASRAQLVLEAAVVLSCFVVAGMLNDDGVHPDHGLRTASPAIATISDNTGMAAPRYGADRRGILAPAPTLP